MTAEELEEQELKARRRGVNQAIAGWIAVVLLAAVVVMLVVSYLRSLSAEDDLSALAAPVDNVCESGGPAAEQLSETGVCERAANATDPNDPENQDPENQDPEIQDPELQDPEGQDADPNDPDPNDPDPTDDPDPNDPDPADDPDSDDPEVQESEVQEPEIQEPEEQDSPVCPPGYEERQYTWNGPDNLPDTADDEVWLVCARPAA